MSMFKMKNLVAALAAVTVIAGVSFDATAAEGQGAKRHRAKGVVTRETTRTRTEDGHTRHTTVTNGQGETATVDKTVVRDAEAGTVTRSREATGFKGGTRSSESVTTRTEDGFTRSGTATNGKGETATRDIEHVRTDSGSVTTTTTTGPNGNTRERTVTRDCDKAAKTCTTTVEGSKH